MLTEATPYRRYVVEQTRVDAWTLKRQETHRDDTFPTGLYGYTGGETTPEDLYLIAALLNGAESIARLMQVLRSTHSHVVKEMEDRMWWGRNPGTDPPPGTRKPRRRPRSRKAETEKESTGE